MWQRAEFEIAVCFFVPPMWEEEASEVTPGHQAAVWTQSQTPAFLYFLFFLHFLFYGNNTVSVAEDTLTSWLLDVMD